MICIMVTCGKDDVRSWFFKYSTFESQNFSFDVSSLLFEFNRLCNPSKPSRFIKVNFAKSYLML